MLPVLGGISGSTRNDVEHSKANRFRFKGSEILHPIRSNGKRRSTAALQDLAVILPSFLACVLECGGAPPLSVAANECRTLNPQL
jgi:hypothetical protein